MYAIRRYYAYCIIPRARIPESGAVTRRRRAQEIVDLGVFHQRVAQVGFAPDTGLYQVVAVDRGRNRDALAPVITSYSIHYTKLYEGKPPLAR